MTTKSKVNISPLLDQKKRQAALKQVRGIWKYKKGEITKEYSAMSKEWERV